jgi:hypothetical protein
LELQNTSVSTAKRKLQCPWQLTLWHHVVDSSVTGRRFSHGCLHFDGEKALVIDIDVTVSVRLILDQQDDISLPFLEDKPAIHQA